MKARTVIMLSRVGRIIFLLLAIVSAGATGSIIVINLVWLSQGYPVEFIAGFFISLVTMLAATFGHYYFDNELKEGLATELIRSQEEKEDRFLPRPERRSYFPPASNLW